MTKLTITVDLGKLTRPTLEELAEAGYISELDYWIDMAYADPPLVFDKALWELPKEPKTQRELLAELAENHLAPLGNAILLDVYVIDPYTFQVAFEHGGAYQTQSVSSLPYILAID